jgi:AraC family transcriptional regulator of adaptative response/methylated-DNA-[protein]-cysteine methyltransferase
MKQGEPTRALVPHVPDEVACWQAVLARDSGQDGSFVWAVRSTGIYCKPSCPARRPRRRQVVFYPVPEAAERCGYRPCRRCRPDQADGADPRVALVRRACRLIETHADGTPTLAALGSQLGLSPGHLQRTFKRIVGITPREYADACRVGRLKIHLKEEGTVTSALYQAGFNASSRLYERSADLLGMTPGTYRNGGKHTHIRYTLADCPLGRLLLAGTAQGVCAVYLGDADGPLERALAAEFPQARRERDEDGLRAWAGQVVDHLRGQRPHLDLPLDVQATAFQWRVWQELRKIPAGSTRTYKEVAEALGQPSAARAVARACATNPVSVVVPCHRVVRGDGGLGGYRWGLKRKQALLDRESRKDG